MKNRFKKILLPVLATLLLCFSSVAHAKEVLRLLCAEFKPFFYTDLDGQVKGILIKLGTDIISTAGYDVDYIIQPPKRIPLALGDGTVDVWIGLTDILNEVSYIGDNVVATMDFTNYTIGPKEVIKSPEDLIGKKIVILRGYSYGGWINFIRDNDDKIDYYEVNSQEAAIKFLKAGRADYLLSYKAAIDKLIADNPVENLSAQLISSFDMRIAVSKKYPRSKELLSELDAAFLKLEAAEL